MDLYIIEQEIQLHICQRCKRDVASGLDAKGFPVLCKSCRRELRKSSGMGARKPASRRKRA